MPPKKGVQKQEQKSPKTVLLAKFGQKAGTIDEPPLQAVILADSYNRRFEVLCTDTPRILLPLCGVPLLGWTLESLSMSKVEQVYIFCGAHADQIRDYISASPYSHVMDIHCLSSQTARSSGDALRELDAMGLFKSDNPFILVHNPLISSYDLSNMVEAHKKRKAIDKNFIMTLGVSRSSRLHPENAIFLVHPPSQRLLHYIQIPMAPRPKRIKIPSHIFSDPFPRGITDWDMWSGPSARANGPGYRDIGVDICEDEVLALCTENFDYQDIRRGLVNGVLTSDLLGKKIAVHLVGASPGELVKGDPRSGEASRYIESVKDTRTFGEITHDMLSRWAFPMVPDITSHGGVQYELRPGNVYIARDNVVLSRTTVLKGPLLIGPRASLQHNTVVSLSTLGADCSIAPNTTIQSSYIFDDVRIGARCTLEYCIIGKDVIISDDVRVGRGVLIGNGVKLGKGITVPEYARIGKERYRSEDWDEDDEVDDEEEAAEEARRLEVLGTESIGYLWPQEEELHDPSSDSDDDGDDPFDHPRNKRLGQLGRSLSNISTDSLDSFSTLSKASSSPPPSPLSSGSNQSLPDLPSLSLSLDAAVSPLFYTEARDTLNRAFEEDHSVDNALVEFRTLVFSYNAGMDRAREEVVKFIMSKIDIYNGAAKALASTTAIWGKWGQFPLELSRSEADSINPSATILDAQKFCVDNAEYANVFGLILRGMYESDVVEERWLSSWKKSVAAQGEGRGEDAATWKEVWAKGKVYVDALEAMEEESDEEDDEDEDDQ